ncbi:MAG: universal stress protein [Chloroflexota bacterium]|nr:universal stress protein [Chloroflexota bacterium]
MSIVRPDPLQRILVPVNGSELDAEMVRLAAATAKRPNAQLVIVYVIVVKRTLPLDVELEEEVRRGEEVLDRAEREAQEYGVEYTSELLQARATGPAIVDEATERSVDLIVMGVTYRRRFGEFYLGQTTPYVLKNAPCRVWVAREPRPPDVP